MNADLQGILDLSHIDQEIFFLRKKQKELPSKIERLKSELSSGRRGTADLTAKAESLTSENSRLEQELLEHRDGLRKSEDRLMQIKTNEEYDAVHSEIATRKTKITETENRLLQIIGELESAQGRITEAQKENSDEAHKDQIDDLAHLENENSGLEAAIATETVKREAAAKAIHPKVLSVYERMYQAKKTGFHVGTVLDSRRSCSICGSSLTPQKFIEVKRNINVVHCESCGSILVWLPQEAVKETTTTEA